MRLPKERIRHMAESLVTRLQQQGHIEITGEKKALRDSIEQTITDELSIEDRLHAEIRQLMKTYEKEIEHGKADYQKMFTMIKQKLVRERGIIL
ncbi:MAG TPA: DUF507 family protein [Nitrospiraceae bacterium]|nr:DUF507 family protein [Nitrospiraceae bacterium]